MVYGSYPYGSTPYGGLAPFTLDIPNQTITATLHVPVWIVKHSEPAQFALGLTVQAPTVNIANGIPLQTLTLTQQAPVPETRVFPALLTLNLTQQAVVHNVKGRAPEQQLVVAIGGQVTNVKDDPSLFTINMALYQPTTNLSKVVVGAAGPFRLYVNAGFDPRRGSLQPTIVRYIKDPIQTGGCPQCGTFMYMKKSRPVRGVSIRRGRNFDKTAYREDKWLKCGRCGWTLHPDRSHDQKEGSRAGWGLRYDEIRADADGDA
jgi:ribosomal protein S27AE